MFKLYYNDLEIRHVREELKQREEAVAAEHEQRQLIEEEMKEKRRELGKINRDQSSLEQEIKKCVCCEFFSMCVYCRAFFVFRSKRLGRGNLNLLKFRNSCVMLAKSTKSPSKIDFMH